MHRAEPHDPPRSVEGQEGPVGSTAPRILLALPSDASVLLASCLIRVASLLTASEGGVCLSGVCLHPPCLSRHRAHECTGLWLSEASLAGSW